MKPSREQVLQAVVSIGEIIPFFPKGSLSDDLIAECLFEFIGDERQLEWFANAAVRRLSKYEGIPQLRPALLHKVPARRRNPTYLQRSRQIRHPRNQCLKRSTGCARWKRMTSTSPSIAPARPRLPRQKTGNHYYFPNRR